jgi:S-DNA-T family DNA segregation ATPase FtsK/SpoIIIE
MRECIQSRAFQESKAALPVALGKTITNEVFTFDLAKAPHMLVAGATGQGKSVGLNAIITSLLYKKHPSQLKIVLVDPKMVEFSVYSNIDKHFLAKLPDAEDPIITDVSKVVQTLKSLCAEMEDRYALLREAGCRKLEEYNDKFIHRQLNPNKHIDAPIGSKEGTHHHFLPYIVAIIDEYGDLIMTAGKEVELPIARIAQKARAVGIHMIIATQRPSAKIVTGIIKANFPARIAFRVSSATDSSIILDQSGAQNLVGRGDLFISLGDKFERVQCAFVDTPEVQRINKFIEAQQGYPTCYILPEPKPDPNDAAAMDEGGASAVDLNQLDPLFDECAELVVASGQGSTSMIQRKFGIGYNRAGRIMDQMEAAGIVGPYQGSKARAVLVEGVAELQNLLEDLKNR